MRLHPVKRFGHHLHKPERADRGLRLGVEITFRLDDGIDKALRQVVLLRFFFDDGSVLARVKHVVYIGMQPLHRENNEHGSCNAGDKNPWPQVLLFGLF